MLLWKAVVANPLLAKTNLVLFLNKCDILQEKLASGIRFAQYVLSYGDRPNDFESVSKCACWAWAFHVCSRGVLADAGRRVSARSEAQIRGPAEGLLARAAAVLLPLYFGHGAHARPPSTVSDG